MANNSNSVPLLTRRELEAHIVEPLLEAFAKEFGQDRTEELVKKVITNLANAHGKELARTAGGNTMQDFAQALESFTKDGANEMEILAMDQRRFEFNMTKCKFADMYRAMGNTRLGVLLSCNRDFALCQGFNPSIKLIRTQTIMEGADHCDFRFRLVTD